jgi:fibronectin type 3 domain-containing protein
MKCLRVLGGLALSVIFASPAFSQLTVNVAAGGDVVGAAYQVLAAGGGTVNLAAGNYYIGTSIVMGPNTTINGAGGPGSSTQSVIYAPQTPNGIAMVTQAYAGASTLTLSNLVLDGNIPQAAMTYGTGNGNYAYNDTGIYFYDQSATTVGVNLTNVEVRHTLRGILTGLVDNLTISGCYFHDNNPGGFSHNMYLVATSGVEIDHTRSDNALTGDGLHIDFGGYFYTIRKSEFSGNNGYGILSQQDNSVTVEDSKLDYNSNDGIQIDAGGLLLTRDQMNINSGYGFNIPDTADGNGQVNGVYTLGDGGTDYFYQASINDFTIYGPSPNTYPAVQATGVIGVVDTADWTLNYPGYTYMGAVDFNANHLAGGSITFPYVGVAAGSPGSTGNYPLVFRYSNGTSGAQTMNVSVNGGASVALSFPSTGSYSTWNTVTMNSVLKVGNNTVTMSVPTGATSAPEIDMLSVTTSTPSAPNAPTNLTGTSTGPYSVSLSWTAPAAGNNNAAQTYSVFRNGANIASNITATSYTDTRIFYGESTYSYDVVAYNQGGGSGASNSVTVTTGIDAPPGLQVSVSPGVPSNNLSWLGVSGAANYVVRRSTVSGGPYQTIATVPANSGFLSYSDTALALGTNYYYVVAAVDASGNVSANSYQVTALSETFTLSASASSVNLSSATPDTISVVGTNGFSDAVNFSVSGLPTGVAASLSATSGSSTQITFTANTSAAQGNYPVTITGTDGNLSSSVGVTVVISSGQLAQVITFPAIPQQAVGNSLTVMATASSGLPVSFSIVQNGNCSISGNVVTFLNGGACGIIASQSGNANFSAAAGVGQVVQVGAPTAQTITFAAIGTQNSGTSISLMATASSGLTVSFASTTPAVCTVSGKTANLIAGGTCTIVASQAGGGIYSAAPNVSQSFSVGQMQTITFGAIAQQPAGGTLVLSATATSGLPVTYTVGSNGNCSLSGSTVTFLHVGSCTINANQAGNASYGAAAQVVQVVTIVVGNPTISFHIPDTHTINSPITMSPTSNSTGPFTFGVVSGPASDPSQGPTLTLTGGGPVTVLTLQNATSDFNVGVVTTTFNSIAGSVWLGNAGSLSTLDLTGALISPTNGFNGGGLGTPAGAQAMAFDSSGSLWVVNQSGGISKFNSNGSVATGSPFTGTGISTPSALAIDGNSLVWVANANGSVSSLSSAGAVVSTATDSSISGATGIAVDNSGSVWVSNSTTNTVDEIIGVAAPTAPPANALQNGTVGVKP